MLANRTRITIAKSETRTELPLESHVNRLHARIFVGLAVSLVMRGPHRALRRRAIVIA